MPTYTLEANVNRHLPGTLPSEVTDEVATDIAAASEVVEANCGSRYGLNYKTGTQKFPDIGDSPATPAIIELCARWLAASYQLDRFSDQVKEGKITRSEKLEKKAMNQLNKIKEGEVQVFVSGSEIGSSNLAGVEDEIYENNDDEPVFNTDNINAHLKH